MAGERLTIAEERAAAHQDYIKAFNEALAVRGFTSTALGEIERTGNYPALNTEAENALNAVTLPRRLKEVFRKIYPYAPAFVEKVSLTEDTIFIRLGVEPTPEKPDNRLIIPPQGENPELQLDPWVIIDLKAGDYSPYKYSTDLATTFKIGQTYGWVAGRDHKHFSRAQLRELPQLPGLVLNAPTVYASSHHLMVIQMG